MYLLGLLCTLELTCVPWRSYHWSRHRQAEGPGLPRQEGGGHRFQFCPWNPVDAPSLAIEATKMGSDLALAYLLMAHLLPRAPTSGFPAPGCLSTGSSALTAYPHFCEATVCV